MKKQVETRLMNDKIKALKLQVISDTGENLGLLSRDKALELAKSKDLDLVTLSEQDGIPLVKIMDHGKTLYAKKKKMSEGKKKQKVFKVKEVKMRPKIGIHDYTTKINQGIKFLNAGHKLKVTLMFRGREIPNKMTLGAELFERVDQTFVELGLSSIAQESESKSGPFWSRIYYMKSKK